MSMSTPSATPHPRILVVDDEPDLRALYELTLLREGYRVDAAGTLAEARSLAGCDKTPAEAPAAAPARERGVLGRA